MELTELEREMLKVFVNEGLGSMGGERAEDLLDDNMSWANSNDLVEILGWNKHQVSGVMSSLETKGVILNSGESPRGEKWTDWCLTDDGIELAISLGL